MRCLRAHAGKRAKEIKSVVRACCNRSALDNEVQGFDLRKRKNICFIINKVLQLERICAIINIKQEPTQTSGRRRIGAGGRRNKMENAKWSYDYKMYLVKKIGEAENKILKNLNDHKQYGIAAAGKDLWARANADHYYIGDSIENQIANAKYEIEHTKTTTRKPIIDDHEKGYYNGYIAMCNMAINKLRRMQNG